MIFMGRLCICLLFLFFSANWDSILLAQSSTVTVSVTTVDAKNPTITVTYDGKTRQLELAKDIVVEIDGKTAEYRSLIPGDDAEVTYDKAQAVVTKIVVQREPMLPAERLSEGWDEIDQRLIFLMVRLANVEASLDAIEDVLGTKDRLANSKLRDAKRAERANEDMDRNAGGPLKWSQFYGTTAEKFFYHPTDRNSSYHTVTVLGQQGSQADNKVGGGVPSSQGLPVHQRPPQFDYIYRSNERAKSRAAAEAADLKGKLDQLAARRQRLEAEQAGLWVEIAFRAIAHYDLDKKPLYRFEPLLLDSDTDLRNRAEAVKATSEFMSLALSIITETERNQAITFTGIKPRVSQARQILNDTYLRLALDVTDRQSSLGRFASLAKRLEDVAANLTDSYVVAMEGDSAKDQQRKETFRAQLQQSLLGYAQIVLAMDEMASELKDQYAYKPDVDKPIRIANTKSVVIPLDSQGSVPTPFQLTELNSDNNDIAPWVSPDGLEIFWAVCLPKDKCTIWTARRTNVESPFYGKQRLFDGHGPVLSPDGLQLFCRDGLTDALAITERRNLHERFPKPEPIASLSFPRRDPAPRWLTEDGLTMYLDMKDENGVHHCWVSKRQSLLSDWSIPQKNVIAIDGFPKNFQFTQTASSSDNLSLSGIALLPKIASTPEWHIGVVTRKSMNEPYSQWNEIQIAASIPTPRKRPLFIKATNELFFVAPNPKDGNDDLWVIKNFKMPRYW